MTSRPPFRRVGSALRAFLQRESASGYGLMFAAALAMIIANSPLSAFYFDAFHLETGPTLSPKIGVMTVHHWINDGLMALFFLLVGLEIKREWLDGHLARWEDRRLPIIGAVAGMVLPAILYLMIAGRNAATVRGWAIPAATDIAFAMAVLALVRGQVPVSIKLLLVTIAIVDDIGAVAIIALLYTDAINLGALGGAALILSVMALMNRAGVIAVRYYLIGFALLWYVVLLSGVHATIAGVLAAAVIPFRRSSGQQDDERSTLHRLETYLTVPVGYVIVPLFGFANAGVAITALPLASFFAPLTIGIAIGLFVGKQIAIFGSLRLAVALGFASRPSHATWWQLYGMALLCGIGFTMGLFIGDLAFDDPVRSDAAKIGVLMGSIASGIAGWIVLSLAARRHSVDIKVS
jgi:Na+:H+ antiporter, NhaA family